MSVSMRHEERMAQLRRIRAAEARESVENAFLAFVALSAEDRRRMVARFNAFQARRWAPIRLHYTDEDEPA